jgi:hypothetical protein
MEDREWMYSGRLGQGQVTDEWIDKTDAFLEQAFGEAANGASKIVCPCSNYVNRKRETKKVMGNIFGGMDLRQAIPGGSTTVKTVV